METVCTSKYFSVFYAKNPHRKKKVYSEGIVVCESNRTKLFTSEGQLLISANKKSDPRIDEQYILNNVYAITIDREVSEQMYKSGKVFLAPFLPEPKPKVLPKPGKSSLYKEEQPVKTLSNGLKVNQQLYEKLHPHQVQGVCFMYECLLGLNGKQQGGCILADFMGLGKTLQAISLFYSMLKMSIIRRIIVVCPLTLIGVWHKECQKWLEGKLTPLMCMGTGEQVLHTIHVYRTTNYRLLLLSYESFYRGMDSLRDCCDLLLFDEGHRLKNKKSKIVNKLRLFPCRKRILLTGTPLQNNLDELYTCISIVNPTVFQSDSLFRNVFLKPILNGMAKTASFEQREIALRRTLQLSESIKQFSLRRKAEVLQQYLPQKTEYLVLCKLTERQKQWYNRCLAQKIADSQVLSFLNSMRKLFTHPKLFQLETVRRQEWSDYSQTCYTQQSFKMQFIEEVCRSAKLSLAKVVVVSYFTETLDFVAEMLERLEVAYALLDGRSAGKERQRIVEDFKTNKTVLLLSGKAGGTGLTLTCATTMVMIEPDWNPSNDSQVMGRIWRQSQEQPVRIFRLIIVSSFQEKILERQQLKQSLSSNLIDDKKDNKSYDFHLLKDIFVPCSETSLNYRIQDDRIQQCKKKCPDITWKGVVHVEIKQSHQQAQSTNEFQELDFAKEEESNLTECEDEEQKYDDEGDTSEQGEDRKYTTNYFLKQSEKDRQFVVEEETIKIQKQEAIQREVAVHKNNKVYIADLPNKYVSVALQKIKGMHRDY